MREFRKKQKILKTIMNILVIFTAIFFLVFIGIEPSVAKYSNTMFLVLSYFGDALIVVCLIILFFYYSRYGKSDKFLENIEYELSDCGYYLTSRIENNKTDYSNAVVNDLKEHGYSVNTNIEVNEFEFDYICSKSKELFYIVNIDEVDNNDILAYLDSVIYDVTAVNVKRKANAVLLFVCNNSDDSAIKLSKMITPLGKKETIKIAIAIAEIDTKRVYFLGNKVSKTQQMIANYVMNCDLPIKDEYKSNDKLPFQAELEEHMKSFNIKDYKDGTFFAH